MASPPQSLLMGSPLQTVLWPPECDLRVSEGTLQASAPSAEMPFLQFSKCRTPLMSHISSQNTSPIGLGPHPYDLI